MNDSKIWKSSKWPFLLGDAVLLAAGIYFIAHAPLPIGQPVIFVAAGCVAFGAILGCLPFILDYRAVSRTIDAAALGSIGEKIQNLEKLAGQISAATNEWVNVQSEAEKTSGAAREIAEGMAAEVRQFSEFMQKMNDSEKSALRLEVEKLHRGEAEWLQVLVRILDHIFLLHTAATRSGQPKLVEQISNFQNACRDAARRMGVVPFSAEADALFDAKIHQSVDGNPADGSTIAETVGAGFTFQGKLLRPALVRLQEKISPAETEELPEDGNPELSLQSPD